MSATDNAAADRVDESVVVLNDLRTWLPTARGMLHAVDGVSLTVAAGETVGIVGESGSGKSMLARSIMQIVPDEAIVGGEIRFAGTDLRTLAPKQARALWGKEISMVFQDPSTSLNPVIRVGRQLAEPIMQHLGVGRKEATALGAALLEQVGIPDPAARMRSYPHEMSGGMRQRVSIAMAIACSPRLLLADEPTTALDVTVQRQILDLLQALQHQSKMAMMLITHDFGVVARRTTRVMVMYAGQIVEYGRTAELFEHPRHPYTKALLDSVPRGGTAGAKLPVISGRPVDVVDPKPGCRFAPRCAFARSDCLVSNPEMQITPDVSHGVACFHPLGSSWSEATIGTVESGLDDSHLLERPTVAGRE